MITNASSKIIARRDDGAVLVEDRPGYAHIVDRYGKVLTQARPVDTLTAINAEAWRFTNK